MGSCNDYVQAPNTEKTQPIRVEIVNTKGPAIIWNITAQKLSLLKLQWSVQTVPGDEIGNITAQKLSLLKLQWSVQTVPGDDNLYGLKNNKHPYPLTRAK